MPTLEGIEFEELATGELDLGPVRRLRCRLEDKLALCRALLGQVKREGSDIVEFAQLPEHPDFPGFFPRELTVAQEPGCPHALLSVAYSKPQFIPGF